MSIYETNFSPMLAPNKQLTINNLPYPLMVSWKINGIRCILHQRIPYTRHLKLIPNIHMKEYLSHLGILADGQQLLLDGELYSKSTSFDDFSGIIRSYSQPLPPDTTYYLFDSLHENMAGFDYTTPFAARNNRLSEIKPSLNAEVIPQIVVTNSTELSLMLDKAIAWGCDGLIGRSINSKYKTIKKVIKQEIVGEAESLIPEEKSIGICTICGKEIWSDETGIYSFGECPHYPIK